MNNDDLFADSVNAAQPLADRMRPRTLDEYVGQRIAAVRGREPVIA